MDIINKSNTGTKLWVTKADRTLTSTKRYLSNLSVQVRTNQFKLFKEMLRPNTSDKVLDVGVTSKESLKDSNIFERLYKPQNKITVATIEDPKKFKKLYPAVKVKKINPGERLPFKDSVFDVVVSWATLEHVGDYKDQETFLNELLRVGKKLFVTTPYRGCFYEPHSGLPFVHWLPLNIFRKICNLVGKNFWASKNNLNPLYVGDIKNMKLNRSVNILIYKMFKFIPSHLIIYI